MANNFFIKFKTQPKQYINPYNRKLILTSFESLDDSVEVSNNLVTITLHSDGSFDVKPNIKGSLVNIDNTKAA